MTTFWVCMLVLGFVSIILIIGSFLRARDEGAFNDLYPHSRRRK